MSAVLDAVAGQDVAMAFLRGAAARPHHAYVLAGPEGSGKSIAARAFVAALLCHAGGCGTCRDCTLALRDHHPNEFVVEPEGRDIHIDTIRDEVWQPAYRTAPEPGRKVFVIREADRLSPAAADTLLKVLEEPPLDTVFLLLSARAHELPETIASRCHVVTFSALPEAFVVAQLGEEGIEPTRALLAARLSGGNLGRARRMAADKDGLAFRAVAADALAAAASGVDGALTAAADVLAAAGSYKKELKGELETERAPFLDDRGRPEDMYRGALRRIETRFARRERRAERDYIDRVLLAGSAFLRDQLVAGVHGDASLRLNVDLDPVLGPAGVAGAAASLAAVEGARAALAEDMNRNPRLVLEQAFLQIADAMLRSTSR
jgi:DNA polymerase-3 subunit delta'